MVKTTMIALIMVCPLVANSEEGWLGATVFIKDDALPRPVMFGLISKGEIGHASR